MKPPNKLIEGSVWKIKNSFTDHGNEIKEIISYRPPLVVRWGTVFFFIILGAITLTSWFIKYPDIVTARASLNSVNAAKEVITRIEGKLIKIAIKENEKVQVGQLLGCMESLANPISVSYISKELDSINTLIIDNHTDEIIRLFPNFTHQNLINNLGELQPSYQTFIQSFITFKDFLSSGFFLRKKKMLQADFVNIQKLNALLKTQKILLIQDLSLSNETYVANSFLANDKVISSLDYRNEKSKLIAKQLSLPQVNTAIINNESQQNEKQKEIAELENQIIVQKNIFIQSLFTLKSQVQSWEFKFLLKAPVNGIVSLAGFFQENQEMKLGQKLFHVQPENISFFVEMLIPQYNFGKVKIGQQVFLKFQAYPFEQYGSVIGKIEYISNTPSDSGYLAKVLLPKGLVTNYKKTLLYHNGLFAQAEIITEDMRLLKHFYHNISKQINR